MAQSSPLARLPQAFSPVLVGLSLISTFAAASYLRDAIAIFYPDAIQNAATVAQVATAVIFLCLGILLTLGFQYLTIGKALFPSMMARALSGSEAETSGERLNAQLKASLKALETHSQSAGRFAASLSEGQSRLQVARDAAHAHSTARFLVGENEKMQRANMTYQRQLIESTRQLNVLREELSLARAENERDALTRVHSRRHFDKVLADAVDAANEENSELSLLMIDIDHFKRINDTFGHLIGDDLLRKFATVFMQSVKGKDTVARYGGEEFSIILPTTKLEAACTVAEQIRQKLASTKWQTDDRREVIGVVTASFGAAQLQPGETPESLIKRADAKLYASKRGGRNRVSR